jgi:hypothetical protein
MKGPPRILDEHEARRLVDRLLGQQSVAIVAKDFGVSRDTVRDYAHRAGLMCGWFYPGRQPMLPADERNGGISRGGVQDES